MKFRPPNLGFFKRNIPALLVILFAIGFALLFAWMDSRPNPGNNNQWNFNMMLSTSTPTISLGGHGWWNNISTPTP